MSSGWKEAKDKWLEGTLLSEDLIQWALTAIQDDDEKLISASFKKTNAEQEPTTRKELDESQKDIRKNLKSNITSLENDLDDLSLNSPNSYKLQISIPSNLNYLLKAWAAADGRDLSGIALHCIEVGLREIKGKGGIPIAATKRYELSCEKRIALAEINNLWEKFNSKNT